MTDTEPADREAIFTDEQSRKAWAPGIERARQIAAESRARQRADQRLARQVTPSEAIAVNLEGFGGFLRCETCGDERPLGNISYKLARGWPMCHGYTMRWWTQRQIDAGDVPEVSHEH